jgi:hypothetical protein
VKSDNVSLDEEVVQSKNNTKVPDIENVSVKTSGIGSDSENNTPPLSPGKNVIQQNVKAHFPNLSVPFERIH